ncbi:MAG: hypothetical protein GYA33_04080 [Thermogutta sp.]|nr:hypothetical protein [Thermogutta sp.]
MLDLEAIFGDPRDEVMLPRKLLDPPPDVASAPPEDFGEWEVSDVPPDAAETSDRCPACGNPLAWAYVGRRICPACRRLPPHWGAACRPRPVAPDVVEEIRRIEAAAFAKGWSHEDLWRSEGWVGLLGLAGVMPPGSEIVSVGPAEIAFRTGGGKVLRFRRHAEMIVA